MHCSKNKELIF